MRYRDLMESLNIRDITIKTQRFLDLWSKGESRALAYLQEEPVMKDLQRTLVKDNYSLMRGFKAHSEEDLEEKLGVPFASLAKGKIVSISNHRPSSWTMSPKVARLFADPTYDTVNHTYYDESDYEDHEIWQGDLIGIGVLVVAKIPKEYILADLTQFSSKLLHYGHDEREVIVNKGTFQAKIISLTHHYREKDDESPAEIDPNFKNTLERERGAIDEYEKLLPKIYRKIGRDPNNLEDIKQALMELPDEDHALALIYMFPDNRELLQFIHNNYDKIECRNKILTLRMLLNTKGIH